MTEHRRERNYDGHLEISHKVMNKDEIFFAMREASEDHEVWKKLRVELRKWASINNIGPIPYVTLFRNFHTIHISTHCRQSHK